MSRAAIVRERIDTAGILERTKRPEDGAAIAFGSGPQQYAWP